MRKRPSLVVSLVVLGSAAAASAAVNTAPATTTSAPAIDLHRYVRAGLNPVPSPVERVRETIARTSDLKTKAELELALANWYLAELTAAPGTRWLIGLEDEDDIATIERAGQQAADHLARARQILAEGVEGAGPLRSQMRVLDAFARVFTAIARAPRNGREYQQRCADAALALATARESDNSSVAAAAQLWQSFAWAMAGNPQRALTSLPEALRKPQEMPYDFMSRLLRCRLLADERQYAAATALCLQIQGSATGWFTRRSADVIDARQRLVALLQMRIGLEWLSELERESPAAAERIASLLDSTREKHFPQTRLAPAWMMESAIPILVRLPDGVPSRASEPAEIIEPATPEPQDEPAEQDDEPEEEPADAGESEVDPAVEPAMEEDAPPAPAETTPVE